MNADKRHYVASTLLLRPPLGRPWWSCRATALVGRPSKGQFPWTGASTLGSYFVSVTSSHYAWAITKLRAHLTISRSTR
ncbi:MAG: ClbS/DfsB family four-helix bundle protein [Dermatophilaceae bacterium]